MNHRDLLGSAARDAKIDAQTYESAANGPYVESARICQERAEAFLALADEIDALTKDRERLEFLIHAAANSRSGLSLERCRNAAEAKWRVLWYHHAPEPQHYNPMGAIDEAMGAWTTSSAGMAEKFHSEQKRAGAAP